MCQQLLNVLESDEECQALLVDHGNLPVFGDRTAAVKDILASNDAFTMDDDIPAECNELPEDAAMLVSYKNTPASKQVVLDNLSALEGL